MSKPQASGQKVKPKRLSIRRTRSPNDVSRHDGEGTDSAIPPAARERLWNLFDQIERDFENVYIENLTCKYNIVCDLSEIPVILTGWFIVRLSCLQNDPLQAGY